MERVSTALLAAVAAGRTVLAPNTELAAALFDAVERVHRDAGDEVWPTPRGTRYSSWLREQHVLRQLDDANAPRLLSEVEERELWRSVIDTAQIGRDFLDPAGAARAARRARRALFEYAIPLRGSRCSPIRGNARPFWSGTAHSSGAAATSAVSARTSAPGRDSSGGQIDWIGTGMMGSEIRSIGNRIDWVESPQWRPAARRWLEQHARRAAAAELAQAGSTLVQAPSAAAEIAVMADWARPN